MLADSALSRLARDVLVGSAALLATVTPLTHLAQWVGLSYIPHILGAISRNLSPPLINTYDSDRP
jgi:hypothetical protein